MDEATIRAMQSLAREVWRSEPELTNVGATVGELARPTSFRRAGGTGCGSGCGGIGSLPAKESRDLAGGYQCGDRVAVPGAEVEGLPAPPLAFQPLRACRSVYALPGNVIAHGATPPPVSCRATRSFNKYNRPDGRRSVGPFAAIVAPLSPASIRRRRRRELNCHRQSQQKRSFCQGPSRSCLS